MGKKGWLRQSENLGLCLHTCCALHLPSCLPVEGWPPSHQVGWAWLLSSLSSSNLSFAFPYRKLHSGMKTYGCELCGKRFLDSLRLRMHLLAHSGRQGCLNCLTQPFLPLIRASCGSDVTLPMSYLPAEALGCFVMRLLWVSGAEKPSLWHAYLFAPTLLLPWISQGEVGHPVPCAVYLPK